MTFASAFLLVFFARTVYGSCPGDCPHTKLAFLYESFKCEPKCSNESNCPVEYKCVDLAANSNVCYFNGNFYKPDETAQSSLTWEQCMGCSCGLQEVGHPGTFNCYYADCIMFNVTEGCRLDEKLGECCYTSQVCPPFQTCTIAKQRFLEGQKFIHPTEKCTKCYCGKGEGGAGVVNCERQYCLDLLFFQYEIMRKCAPLYQETDVCCPSGWICRKYLPLLSNYSSLVILRNVGRYR
ncbi:uncharacterized protein LOC116179731 [Photinus pyralis]|uniref:uncharacterized protein LOC116179692 n=1 Tax=Photinus pyralis TaxID=7054 RepID=UPI0012674CE9|nr:uncharacterized protein LOC116179692 [Photinus pyralis]XP_031355413.1 uncharacterized protein LOC116179731 [Photinus pyralis]